MNASHDKPTLSVDNLDRSTPRPALREKSMVAAQDHFRRRVCAMRRSAWVLAFCGFLTACIILVSGWVHFGYLGKYFICEFRDGQIFLAAASVDLSRMARILPGWRVTIQDGPHICLASEWTAVWEFNSDCKFVFVIAPLVYFIGIFATLSLVCSRLSKRRVAGICTRCGYDLRASPERSPECGAVATIVTAEVFIQ